MTRWSALACLLVLLGCDGGSEPDPVLDAGEPSAEEQYRAALAGMPDAQVQVIAQQIDAALASDEGAALAAIDMLATTAPALLQHGAFMKGWGVIAIELAGVTPRHSMDHPGCSSVEEVLGGWSSAAGATAREITGTSVPGPHAAAALLFVSKKCAQSHRLPIAMAFEHANICAQAYTPDGGACGMPGDPCCNGTCNGGTTCIGGLCL